MLHSENIFFHVLGLLHCPAMINNDRLSIKVKQSEGAGDFAGLSLFYLLTSVNHKQNILIYNDVLIGVCVCVGGGGVISHDPLVGEQQKIWMTSPCACFPQIIFNIFVEGAREIRSL